MKAKVKNLSSALKDVHKRFLEQERRAAEEYFQKKIAPMEFLTILTQDRSFEWLRPFSALIADIDVFIKDEESIGALDLGRIKGEVEYLTTDPDSSLSKRYLHHLNNDAEFIMYHSTLKNELSSWEAKK